MKLEPDTIHERQDAVELEYFNSHPGIYARVDSARAAAKRFDPKTEKRLMVDWKAVKRSLPSVFEE